MPARTQKTRLTTPKRRFTPQTTPQTDEHELECLRPKWQAVTISPNGTVEIHFADGSEKTLAPPATDQPKAAE